MKGWAGAVFVFSYLSASPAHLSPRVRWTRLRHQDYICDLLSPSMHSFPMQESPKVLSSQQIQTLMWDGRKRRRQARTRLMMLNTTVHEPNHSDTHARSLPTASKVHWMNEQSNESFPIRRGISMNSTYASHHVMTIVVFPCVRSRSSGPGSRASPISRSSFCCL